MHDAPSPTPVDPWSTLTVRSRRAPATAPRELDQIRALGDLLDALGGLLAELDEVAGVELRDPTTFDGPERAELVVYTTPAGLEAVDRVARAHVEGLGLAPQVELLAETHHDDSWFEGWKAFYRPLRFGADTLLVRPSWIEPSPGDPELELVLDPGRAFGTGQHETTHLCLDLLVGRHEAGDRPTRILDLGCGSGILAIAAARLCPDAAVLAVDIDPEATATCEENRALNDMEGRVEVRTGDVEHGEVDGYDLVLANIRPEVLVPQAAKIAARLRPAQGERPGGVLILSGILDVEREQVVQAYAGLTSPRLETLAPPLARGEWVALSYRRAP